MSGPERTVPARGELRDRFLRYWQIRTEATETALVALERAPVVWDRSRECWRYPVIPEAWSIVRALHDAGLRLVPRAHAGGGGR
jgi:hypothetical protein